MKCKYMHFFDICKRKSNNYYQQIIQITNYKTLNSQSFFMDEY